MVNFNVNWDRWIKSSVAKHFNDESLIGINENQTVLFIEGFERNTDGKKDWIEFRLDGPYYEETTKGHWKIEIEVNILVVVNERKIHIDQNILKDELYNYLLHVLMFLNMENQRKMII